MNGSKASTIWILAEHDEEELADSTLEISDEARATADACGAEVHALLFGRAVFGMADELASRGVDYVHLYAGDGFEQMDVERYASAFERAIGPDRPMLVMMASTIDGRALAPRLAAKFGYGFVPCAVSVSVVPDGGIEVLEARCAGKVHEKRRFAEGLGVCALFEPGSIGTVSDPEPMAFSRGEAPYDEPERSLERLSAEPPDPREVPLQEADRILACGLACRSADDVAVVRACADALGAALGSSKPLVDNGLMPQERLIGQSSGRRLSPGLCLVAGVSGSSHFVEGMRGSRHVIAVNKDKGAPIAKLADLTAVGDMFEILPEVERLIGEKAGREEMS